MSKIIYLQIASELIFENMSKIIYNINTTNHKKLQTIHMILRHQCISSLEQLEDCNT